MHDNRRAHGDATRVRRRRIFQGALPRSRHLDAEAPGIRRIWFRPADDAGGFIVRRVISMGVNRRRACLEPNARGRPRLRNRIADHLRRLQTRLRDDSAIRGSVATVHTLACQIDNRIGRLKFLRPLAERFAIPRDGSPREVSVRSTQHDDFMTARVKSPRQHLAKLT